MRATKSMWRRISLIRRQFQRVGLVVWIIFSALEGYRGLCKFSLPARERSPCDEAPSRLVHFESYGIRNACFLLGASSMNAHADAFRAPRASLLGKDSLTHERIPSRFSLCEHFPGRNKLAQCVRQIFARFGFCLALCIHAGDFLNPRNVASTDFFVYGCQHISALYHNRRVLSNATPISGGGDLWGSR